MNKAIAHLTLIFSLVTAAGTAAGTSQSTIGHSADESQVSGFPNLMPNDLWQRWQQSASLPQVQNERVQRQIEFLLAGKRTLRRTFRRASPYLFHIVEALETANLPVELAMLPAIESAYDATAQSPAKAAGLWQFIPATARDYGLKIDQWQDMRLSAIASTAAAVKFLTDLGNRYQNDWLLVLAAYNTGPGNVDKALARARQKVAEPGFWDLHLPDETMLYVPRFLAMLSIAHNAAEHGIDLPFIANQPHVTSTTIGRRYSHHRLAAIGNIEPGKLQQLNYANLRGASPPEGPHEVTLEIDDAMRIEALLKQQAIDNADTTWHNLPHKHKVVRGDSLSTIAERYHKSVAELYALNNLSDSKIRAGSTLLVGHIDSHTDSDQVSVARSTPVPTKKTGPLEYRFRTITVEKGDSLWRIARKLGSNSRELRRWNRTLSGKNYLSVGTTVRHAALRPSALASGNDQPALRYLARTDDSLQSIASKFNVPTAHLRQHNPRLNKSGKPQAGQTIRVPFQPQTATD